MRDTRRSIIAALIILAAAVSAKADDAPKRPNILLIVADDLGWRDVGWHGGAFQTPVLDRLVREGVELDRHYVQPVCSPTRTALLSGRWTGRFGPHVLSPTNLRAFPTGTPTLASVLKSAGYTTHIAGKWHLGSRMEWGPNHYGFDHSYGSLNGAVDPWTHKYRTGPYEDTWHRNLQRVDEEGNATELVARKVTAWIKQRREPWLIYVPFHAVHIPVDAPEEYRRKYADAKFHDDPAKNESLRRLAAFVTQLDTKIGEFVTALEQTDQRRNTLIVFTSDNGGKHNGDNPYMGSVPATPALSSNLPLRGQKAQLYKGGVRVCAFANWPGRLTPRQVTAPLHAVDWMPTLTKLAGATVPQDVTLEGLDAWPLLTGAVTRPPPRTIYIPMPRGAAVLHGDWKLIEQRTADVVKLELFHITADPHETTDLSQKEPARVAELQRVLADLRRGDVTKLPDDLKGIPN